MAYGLKYTVPFRTLSEIPCEVRIEVKDYTGQPRELIGGADPFVIETQTHDLLSPIRASLATLSVFGSDYLQDLYTSDPQGIRITLYVDGAVHWLGYMTPDTFSQDFTNPEFIYEIECASALSSLKYKEFDLTADFISFWEIVNKAREYAGYRDVYYTNSVRAKTVSYFALRIASANFYDELGEAMTYYEVLEEIAKYAGCCFTPYKNDLYFLDYQAIKEGYVSYTVMSGGVSNLSDLKQVKNYKGTGAKISRIAGKNKAVVNCSLYEIKNLIPEFDEKGATFHSLKKIDTTIKEGKENVTYTAIIRKYDQPKFTFYHYSGGNPNLRVESSAPVMGNDTGSSFVRTAEFRKEEPPARLSMTNEMQVKLSNSFDEAEAGKILTENNPVLKIESEKAVLTHKDLWFAINLQVKWYTDEWSKDDRGLKFTEDGKWNLKTKLKLGNYYYNGTSWVTTESTFSMPIPHKKEGLVLNNYRSVENQNTYDKGLGDLTGYLFKAPPFPVIGMLELTLYSIPVIYFNPFGKIIAKYFYLKDLELTHGIPDEQSIYGDWVGKDTKNDVIYENVIEGEYIDPADEIDLKICTNSDGKLALSSVLEGDGFLTEIETDVFGTAQPENILLQRVVDLYDKPRFVIDPTLANDAKPWTVFTEPYLNKQYLVAGGEENVKMESARYNLIEL